MCCTIRCVLTLTCPGRPSHTKWSIQHQGVLFVCGASCSWAQDSSRNSLGCFVQYDSSNFFTPFVRHLVVWCARYDTYGFGYVSPSPKFSFDVACTILLLQLHTVGYAVYTRPNSVVIGTSTQYVDRWCSISVINRLRYLRRTMVVFLHFGHAATIYSPLLVPLK